MLSLQRTRQKHHHIREFRGPEPGSVMVLARGTSKKPADWIIQERRKEEDARAEVMSQLRYQNQCDLRGEWEHNTTQKIQKNTVKRRANEQRRLLEMNLEGRRDNLRCLLESEEQNYIREMNDMQETTIERQAKLRERARHLKEKKETERQELAQEKYQQLWRSQSEGLRTMICKRTVKEIQEDRFAQIRMKEDLGKQKAEEDAYFKRLWAEELQKKVDREERDTQAIEVRNREQAHILEQQIAAHKAKKQEEKRLLVEEKKLLEDMARLREIEDRKTAEEKRRKEEGIRDMLQMSVRMKMRRKAKEMQEELAFDTMILEQLSKEAEEEAESDALRKVELREEDRRYRQYLAAMKAAECEREREMERLADKEIEKQWQARVARWDREAAQRKALLDQVLGDRKRQVQERMLENERQRALAMKEREEIAQQIEENKLKDIAEKEALKESFHSHQRDLLSQIEFNRHLRQLEQEEEQREIQKMLEAQREYQHRMDAVMQDDWVDPKGHPMRRAMQMRSATKQ